jgi:hypothetical protein
MFQTLNRDQLCNSLPGDDRQQDMSTKSTATASSGYCCNGHDVAAGAASAANFVSDREQFAAEAAPTGIPIPD